MVGIKNCVLVLSVTILAACATPEEPMVLAASNVAVDSGDADDYEISCKKETKIGTRIASTVCRIVYAEDSPQGVVGEIRNTDIMRDIVLGQRPEDK
jgi:hypothetical protein